MELLPGDSFDPQDPQVGMYLGVHEETYHSCKAAVSKHTLEEMELPYRCKYKMDNPPERTKPALLEGSLIDTLVFEPNEYDARFFRLPDGMTAQKKEGKAIIAAQQALGKMRVMPAQWEMAQNVTKAVRNHRYASTLLDSGYPQVVMVWEDSVTGLLCKGRMDWYNDAHDFIIDLKTAVRASPWKFGNASNEYTYDVQAQYYSWGWKVLTGREITKFVFLIVEKEPPYPVALREMDFQAAIRGKNNYRKWLLTYATCVTRDEWPSYPEEIVKQSLPPHAYYEDR